MPIRCHAEQTSRGVMLSRMETQADADSLRVFFLEQAIAAVAISPRAGEGHDQVLLPGLTLEVFHRLIERANIELV